MNTCDPVRKHSVITVVSKSYLYQFPYEVLQSFEWARTTAWIGSRKLNEEYHKLIHWNRGFSRAPFTDLYSNKVVNYLCKFEPDCTTFYTVNYMTARYRCSTGIVTKDSARACSCVRNWVSCGNSNWKDLLVLKYESYEHVLGALMWFFANKNLAPPIFRFLSDLEIFQYSACLTTVDFYNRRHVDGTPPMAFVLRRGGDGGYRIIDTLQYDSRIQKKCCVNCHEYKGSKERGSVLFELSCSRKHAVCDTCVAEFFGERSNMRFIDEGDIETSVKMNCVKPYCIKCEEEVKDEVMTAFGEFSLVKAATPVAWFGEKAMYSKALFGAVKELFVNFIDWFGVALIRYRNDYKHAKMMVKDAKRSLRNALLDEDMVSFIFIKPWMKYCNKQKRKKKALLCFLGKRMHHVAFLFNRKMRFPNELLLLDEVHFIQVLGRYEFLTLESNLSSA